MRGGLVSALALVAGLGLASPAAANEKRDFETCDGRVHPARADDGMRGEASPPLWQVSLSDPVSAIAACDRALASSRLLASQTVRRAHLLRARAVKKMQAGQADGALADLDAARRAAPERAGDRFYARSMGVSLDLLQALALLQKGSDPAEARRLATAAMAARPYSMQVQILGAEILHALEPLGGGSAWAGAARLEPAAATTLLLREAEAGNFKAVVALRPGVAVNWPAETPNPAVLLARNGGGNPFLQSLLLTLHTAYARAATGDPAGARRDVDEVRGRMKALAATPRTGAIAVFAEQALRQLEAGVGGYTRLIDARIALAEGRHSEALAALVGEGLPKNAMTVELLTALKAAVPAKDAALVPAADGFASDVRKDRSGDLSRLASQALIAPETPRAVVDYSRSRPNILGALIGGAVTMGTSLLGGISRTDGFRSTNNADGTIKVEFVGNTPSAALVGEMTLLRAAEVAREKGKAAFLIIDRNDYQRMMVMSRGGIEQSRTPQGYKTELTIRLLDTTEGQPRALDATAVIDGLGPLYYEERPSGRG